MTKKKKKGFTLIELLIVIAIVGVLATVVILNLSASAREKARIARLQNFADSVRGQLSGSPIMWMKMDEGAGNTTVDTWSGINGTLGNALGVGLPIWDQGVDGQALRFDGTCRGVNIPGAGGFAWTNKAVTMEAWINPSVFSGIVFGSYWSYYIYITSRPGGEGAVQFSYRDSSLRTSITDSTWGGTGGEGDGFRFTSSDLNIWHHIAASYSVDTNRVMIFVDGEAHYDGSGWGSTNINPPGAGSPNALRIGALNRFNNCNGGYFNGIVDEVRLYGEALTAQEIRRHYVQEAPKFGIALK
ncbi:LamG-like jellyroll fold domain-containing protein [Patescibacteria group bacterium]